MKMSGPLSVKMSFHLPHTLRRLSLGHTNCHLLCCLHELVAGLDDRLGLHGGSLPDVESLEFDLGERRLSYPMLCDELPKYLKSDGGSYDDLNTPALISLSTSIFNILPSWHFGRQATIIQIVHLVYVSSRARSGDLFSQIIEVCPIHENKGRVSLREAMQGHHHLLWYLSSL